MIIHGEFGVSVGPKVSKLNRLRWLFLTLCIIRIENDWMFHINLQNCFSLNSTWCNLTSLNFRVISLSKGLFSSLLSFAWIPTLQTSFPLKRCSKQNTVVELRLVGVMKSATKKHNLFPWHSVETFPRQLCGFNFSKKNFSKCPKLF